jgi:hypothetical protein
MRVVGVGDAALLSAEEGAEGVVEVGHVGSKRDFITSYLSLFLAPHRLPSLATYYPQFRLEVWT